MAASACQVVRRQPNAFADDVSTIGLIVAAMSLLVLSWFPQASLNPDMEAAYWEAASEVDCGLGIEIETETAEAWSGLARRWLRDADLQTLTVPGAVLLPTPSTHPSTSQVHHLRPCLRSGVALPRAAPLRAAQQDGVRLDGAQQDAARRDASQPECLVDLVGLAGSSG